MSEIQIENVSFGYEDGMVLENASMEIKKGDFVGIIGSNGTGKSTLIKLMLGLLPLKTGKIVINDHNIGYVPQVGLAVKADFPATVQEVVMLNLYQEIGLFKRPGKKHIELVDKALETVGMLDKADKQIGKLSGGQQQRVMIAKALVASPEVLILDEPAAAIDSENEQQLYHLLQRLNVDKKLTIIMVTHSIENVEQSMNKIYVIKNKLVTRRK
ncbi:zinc transport system ATP-binding protein [Lachnotalea glycerini]|uniref:Zinc transport system ATP-binding protein n=1 Tax=Lachnotalea glycerini TaxID=1763509 RepID=A0A318EYP1_9FIRM|nr:metal ABC transporter ATP-binding protein [Lachnotalea glycerini]PXV96206.1 zinc transport system ATP-binding protein [Lachnotalea glycerini]